MDTAPARAAQLTIQVVATTVDGTEAALRVAVPLARGARARLNVIVPHVVPYAVGLDTLAPADFFAKRYRAYVQELDGNATIDVCSCRRIEDVIAQVVSRHATVIIGGPVGRWLTSPEERFASTLVRAGLSVVFVPCGCNATQRRMAPSVAALAAFLIASTTLTAQQESPRDALSYGGFIDLAATHSTAAPQNHLFRSRGTTPRVDEVDVNMAAAYLRRSPSEQSRFGIELTAQGGEDSKLFGFSATAPNIAGAAALLHLGPTNVSYLAPAGRGLTIQGGIFSSLIGYDSLYAKDNLTYTRPWGADFTPYLMLGVNASYPVTPKVTATAGVVNGYWHLANANDVPSVVGQIAYKPSDQITVRQTALYGPHQASTAIGLWRVLSDTIVERKTPSLTTALEYQFSAERVDTADAPEAFWMSAQAPLHWTIRGPVSATVRPEICWDSDGRWTGVPQRVVALTAGGEYRIPLRGARALVRAEYRVDDSRGSGGGFFAAADNHLVPTQNLFVLALIVTYDGTIRR